MWTKAFWKGLAERAIKTFFQSGVAAASVSIGSTVVGLGDISWSTVLSIAALATVLSAATSIGNADFTAGAAMRSQAVADAETIQRHILDSK